MWCFLQKPSSWERHPSIQVYFHNFSRLKNPAHAINIRIYLTDQRNVPVAFFFTDLCFWWSVKYFYLKVGKLNVLCKYLVDTKFVTYTVLGTCFYFAKKSDTCNYVMDDVFSLRRTCQCLFPLIHWTKPVDSVSCSCNEVCPIYYNIM